MPRARLFVGETVIKEIEKAGKINHLSMNAMLLIIAHAFQKGHLTVYNGEIMTKKTLYETPKGIVIK